MHRFLRTLVTAATLSLVLGLATTAGAQTNTVPTVQQGGNVDATAVQNSPGRATTPTNPVRGLDPGEEAADDDGGGSVLPWVLIGLVLLLVVAGGAVAVTRGRRNRRATEPVGAGDGTLGR